MTTPAPSAPPPPAPASSVEYQTPFSGYADRDAEHLKILSICWYVASGLAALMGFVPVVYIVFGALFILSPGAMGGGGGPPPPPFVGWMLVIMGSAFAILIWTSAILGFITAYSLPKRRRVVVCYIAAAVACLQVPVGTVLGIFTFLVLSRPSIKSSFS